MNNSLSNNDILNTLNEQEKEYALKILKELNTQGQSKSYDDLLYSDYKEIPVDIETFLRDDRYLGNAWKDANGKLKLYDFWLDVLKEIFPTNIDTNYNTLLETGARGLGKSEIACGCVGAYLMYRVMCLKNPLQYYHLKQTEKICFAFVNIKLALAEEIAISKFQKTIQLSPWFTEKGKMTSFHGNPYWVPPEPINIIIGSQADDVIGQPIFYCLDGETIVNTTDGDYRIQDLVDKPIKVHNVDDEGNLTISDECTVKVTGEYMEEYELELEDGSIIKCTPNHRFMLITGEYKQARDLTLDDEIMTFMPYGYIYKTTNLVNNKIYIGQKTSKKFLGESYLGSGKLLSKAVKKYGHNNFTVELLEWCIDRKSLDDREKYYIRKYNSTDKLIGYNIAEGGQGGNFGEEVNKKISSALKGHTVSQDTREKLRIVNTGKHPSEETKLKISIGNTGKIISEYTRKKMSESAKLIDRKGRKTSKGLRAITNGADVKYISEQEDLPDGWHYGNCKTSGKHNMSRYYSNELMQQRRSASTSGSNNPMYGNGCKISGGKNGKATKTYFYDGAKFECRKYLVEYLKENVDETISLNLIRAIENNTYSKRTINKYTELINKLSWRNKDEN